MGRLKDDCDLCGKYRPCAKMMRNPMTNPHPEANPVLLVCNWCALKIVHALGENIYEDKDSKDHLDCLLVLEGFYQIRSVKGLDRMISFMEDRYMASGDYNPETVDDPTEREGTSNNMGLWLWLKHKDIFQYCDKGREYTPQEKTAGLS